MRNAYESESQNDLHDAALDCGTKSLPTTYFGTAIIPASTAGAHEVTRLHEVPDGLRACSS